MIRSRVLLEKRRDFVLSYMSINSKKQMKVIVQELSERLFLSERTIAGIISDARKYRKQINKLCHKI